ncbi:unnamed protein product, partial [marine sediment metagenome]
GWSKTLAGVPASAKKKATGATKEKPKKSSPKKGGKKPVAKKTKKKSGFRLPGGLGPKGILTGVLGLAFIPRFIPVTTPGAAKLGTGLVLRALNLGGGGALASVGIMEMVAGFVLPTLGGLGIGAPAGNAGNSGGYDY